MEAPGNDTTGRGEGMKESETVGRGGDAGETGKGGILNEREERYKTRKPSKVSAPTNNSSVCRYV